MKTVEQLNREIKRRNDRAQAIAEITKGLEQHTRWGKHMARPAQIRAGARKLFDVLSGQLRRARREDAAAA